MPGRGYLGRPREDSSHNMKCSWLLLALLHLASGGPAGQADDHLTPCSGSHCEDNSIVTTSQPDHPPSSHDNGNVESSAARELEVEEGRRRQYNKAFPMMVAGYIFMSSFLVPLGFQFMAMVAGKALLLSKMALMGSLYGGLKRIYPDIDYYYPFLHRNDKNYMRRTPPSPYAQ